MNPYSDYATDEQRDGVCKATNQINALGQRDFVTEMERVRNQAEDEKSEKRKAQEEWLKKALEMRKDLSFDTASSDRFYEELESEIDRLKGVLK
jgi:aminoglycoside phosphotransferase family enzyme